MENPIRQSPRFERERTWIHSLFKTNITEEDLDNVTEEILIVLLEKELEIAKLHHQLIKQTQKGSKEKQK